MENPTTENAQREARSAPPQGSAHHRICKDCIHAWTGNKAPPYGPASWCYMFRSGEHVDAQGYCGQFRISPDVPNAKLCGHQIERRR